MSLLCGPCDMLVDEAHDCPFGCTRFLKAPASFSCVPCSSAQLPADYVEVFGSDEEDVPLSKRVIAKPLAAAAATLPAVDDATRYLSSILKNNDELTQQVESMGKVAQATSQERDIAVKERDAAKQIIESKEGELQSLKRKIGKQAASKPVFHKPCCDVLYTNIIGLVSTAYTQKAATMKANYKPPAPPPPVAPVVPTPKPGPPMLLIIQKNSNPSYHTEREIKYEATGANDELFYFDSSAPLTPWSPQWTAMDKTLSATIASSLGAVSACKRLFTTQENNTMSYTHGQHSYDVTVVRRPYPVAPAAPAPPPPPPPPSAVPWEVQVLFEGDFVQLDKTTVENWLAQFDFAAENSKAKTGGALISNLAELFTSFGTPTKFDPKKCEMWVKPHWLKTWLLSVVKRGYTEARLGMHGMKDGPYELLFEDVSAADPMKSAHGNAQGYGFYVAASNEIAAQYGRRALVRAGCSSRHNYGTALIGLILTTPGLCSDPKRRVDNGAFSFYALANTVGAQVKYPSCSSTCGPTTWNDAFCVRDQTIWLPLGLACAKK